MIRECVAVGVKGAIIVSAGFKEIGEAGAALEQQVLAEEDGVECELLDQIVLES